MEATYERGTGRDYELVAHWHYRAGRPATIAGVWRARAGDELAGVLVVSNPTLNGRWRERAWPGEFSSGDKRRDARELNARVRTISRVVVEPRFRGLSIASGLVRAYLADALTTHTEALSAMGRFVPLFVSAGMREVRLGRTGLDRELGQVLEYCGVAPWELADVTRGAELLARHPGLERMVRRYAHAHAGLRRFAGARGELLARVAARAVSRLVAPAWAYVTP